MYLLVIFVVILAIDRAVPQTVQTTEACPEGFKHIGKKCYFFSKDLVQWNYAPFRCEELNSTLLVFKSIREQNLVKGFLEQDNNRTVEARERWIDGLYDWKNQLWKWGSVAKTIDNTFAKKNKGPEFKWHCLALDGSKKNKWVAESCTKELPYICDTLSNATIELKLYNRRRKKKFNISKCSKERLLDEYERKRCQKLLGTPLTEPGQLSMRKKKHPHKKRDFDWICPQHMISLGNRCYFFSTDERTWQDAYYECDRNDTKLALVRNKAQDYSLRIFLNNFIEKHDRWIGGRYDWRAAKWRWATTAEPMKYRGFDHGLLKGKLSSELSWTGVFMDPSLDNQWNFARLTKKKRFICQVKAKGVKRLDPKRRKNPQAVITVLEKRGTQ